LQRTGIKAEETYGSIRENKQRSNALVAGMEINTVVGKRGGRLGKTNKRDEKGREEKKRKVKREREREREKEERGPPTSSLA